LVFAAWIPDVDPLPPWTTLPWPGAALAAPLPALLPLEAVVAVVSVGAAAVVVVAGAAAATVWVVLLSFLPISTPSNRKTPSSAIAPIATAGDHCCAVRAGAVGAPLAPDWPFRRIRAS